VKIFEDTFDIVKSIHSAIEDKAEMRLFRISALKRLGNKSSSRIMLLKLAFDTRRIDQYSDANPRRNLQYYHRSEPFITEEVSDKIKTFFKLKFAVDAIKEEFIGDPDYLDSYCRILSFALDKTLRVDQKDMDFGKPQMDYLEELLYLRYRLKPDDINRLSEKELRSTILGRDEKLLHKEIYAQFNNGGLHKINSNQPSMIKNQEVVLPVVKTQDALIEKLFGDIKASSENKNVKRSVTITIDDQIVDKKE
jgi:hypothetical protein